MSVAISCLIILIVSLVAIFMACLIIQRQRMLKAKRTQCVNCRKKKNFYHSRYQFYQKDLERLRSDYNHKLRDITVLSREISTKKNLIMEILEILIEENKQIDDRMSRNSDKITDRRKNMIGNYWQELNGAKTAYMEKVRQAHSDQVSLKGLQAKQGEEFDKFIKIKSELKKLEADYARLLKNPVLPFGPKKT